MTDQWKEVARLRFRGGDFDDGILEVRALEQILLFRGIVQETAKVLWRAANPDRQRLPDHFEDELFLGMGAVRSASVEVSIQARLAHPERLTLWDDQDPVSLAARLAYDTFAATAERRDLPSRFRRELLPEYARLGQGLPDGTGFSIAVENESPIPVTQAGREWLSARLEQDYEDSLNVLGRVESVDVGKQKVAIRADPDGRIEVEYPPDREQEVIGALSAHRTARIRLRARCMRSGNGHLRRLTEVLGLEFFPEGEPERDACEPGIEDRIARIAEAVPDEEWERLPEDLSQRVDYYLYGADGS